MNTEDQESIDYIENLFQIARLQPIGKIGMTEEEVTEARNAASQQWNQAHKWFKKVAYDTLYPIKRQTPD